MFNSQQKEKFIDYTLNNSIGNNEKLRETDWVNFFNRLEDIEKTIEKDFAEFDYSEMMNLLPLVLRKKVSYQRQVLSLLRTYLNWCIENECSKDSENRLIGITPDDIDFSKSYSMCMVKDEQQLSEYLDKIFRDIKEDSNDNMYRLMCHLIFNGIERDLLFDLKLNQINLENQCIHLKNDTLNLSETCCKLIKYNSEMSAISYGETRYEDIFKAGYVLENTSKERDKMFYSAASYLSKKFAELKEILHYPIAITMNTLYRSGQMYRLYLNEQNNIPLNLDNTLLLEYQAWKKAFQL